MFYNELDMYVSVCVDGIDALPVTSVLLNTYYDTFAFDRGLLYTEYRVVYSYDMLFNKDSIMHGYYLLKKALCIDSLSTEDNTVYDFYYNCYLLKIALCMISIIIAIY